MVDAAKTGAWDMAFLGIDPAREGEIGFTAAYLEIEATLPGAGGLARSPRWRTSTATGVRVAAAARANYELFLTRDARSGPSSCARPDHPAAFEILQAGQADALAGLRQALLGPPAAAARIARARRPLHGGAAGHRGAAGARRGARVPPRRRRGGESVRPGRARDRADGRPGRAVAPRAVRGRMIPDFLYGTAWKEDRTAALTELALRSGFRGIDTANQRRHYFEAGVGQGLAAAYRAGIVSREDLFLQTKFTYQAGQDHRLPYDPAADLSTQVAQSLGQLARAPRDGPRRQLCAARPRLRPRLDGPRHARSGRAMARERDAGRVRLLGVSNVSLRHLQQLAASGAETPAFVQNRCFARVGWDRDVRAFCATRKIVYQGFSLLTANVEALRHPLLARHRRAPSGHARPGGVPVRAGGRHAPADGHDRRRPHAGGPRKPRAGARRRTRCGPSRRSRWPEGVDAPRVRVVLCCPDSTVSRGGESRRDHDRPGERASDLPPDPASDRLRDRPRPPPGRRALARRSVSSPRASASRRSPSATRTTRWPPRTWW